MKEFELPTNIRQIGGISDSLRIYMEDYVFTYLRQLAESGEGSEKMAFLVGKHMVIDSQPTIFINGALQAAYSESVDGIEQFTEKSFNHAEEQIDMYFKGYEIVGWMLSQPGYGVNVNASYAEYHISNFNKPYHALFVMDPVEKLNTFYTWGKDNKKVEECKGYFVYYKQNENMQEYMMNNQLATTKSQKIPVITSANDTPIKRIERKYPYTQTNTGRVDNKRGDKRREDLREEVAKSLEAAPETTNQPVRRSYISEVIGTDQKRVTNILVSLSAVLFIICFIMGAGLIQSDGRINRLEQEVNSLNQANEFMSSQIRQIAAMEVFAGSNATMQTYSPTPTQTPMPTQTLPPTQSPPPSTETPGTTMADPTPMPTALPTAVPQPPTPTPTAPPATTGEYRIHIVIDGETLFGISLNFGMINRMNEIIELNNIEGYRIYAGMELRIPY